LPGDSKREHKAGDAMHEDFLPAAIAQGNLAGRTI